MIMAIKKLKGYILGEVVAAIAVIAILTHISTWYNSAKTIKAQAQEGYDFATQVATNVVDYYEENTAFPTGTTYDYGTDPGEYVASVVYHAPVASTTHGYTIATFRSGPNGLQTVLQGKWIIQLLSVSGPHLVTNCYTNINSAFMSGTTLAAGSDSDMVGHSCEVADTIASVIDV